MSKIACLCGHIIVDQTDFLSYKGDIIPDVLEPSMFEKLSTIIDSLTDAIENGQREKWINENFSDPYPMDLQYSSMVHDLFLRYYINETKNIYQCENCGRILIQIGKSQQYSFFRPESDNWRNILGREE
jgi:hypothetical protein